MEKGLQWIQSVNRFHLYHMLLSQQFDAEDGGTKDFYPFGKTKYQCTLLFDMDF